MQKSSNLFFSCTPLFLWYYLHYLMQTFIDVLPYVQIALAVLLMVAVLLQQTGAGLGGAFGADNFSSGFHTRRGFERTLFYVTILLAIAFVLSALVSLAV